MGITQEDARRQIIGMLETHSIILPGSALSLEDSSKNKKLLQAYAHKDHETLIRELARKNRYQFGVLTPEGVVWDRSAAKARKGLARISNELLDAKLAEVCKTLSAEDGNIPFYIDPGLDNIGIRLGQFFATEAGVSPILAALPLIGSPETIPEEYGELKDTLSELRIDFLRAHCLDPNQRTVQWKMNDYSSMEEEQSLVLALQIYLSRFAKAPGIQDIVVGPVVGAAAGVSSAVGVNALHNLAQHSSAWHAVQGSGEALLYSTAEVGDAAATSYPQARAALFHQPYRKRLSRASTGKLYWMKNFQYVAARDAEAQKDFSFTDGLCTGLAVVAVADGAVAPVLVRRDERLAEALGGGGVRGTDTTRDRVLADEDPHGRGEFGTDEDVERDGQLRTRLAEQPPVHGSS